MGFGVKRESVIKALRAKKIPFVERAGYFVEIAGPHGGTTEYIPPELGRREPVRLEQLYGIPRGWLYEPLMIPGEEDDKPVC